MLEYPNDPTAYLPQLVQRLHKFELTKAEVLMIINHGVGLKDIRDPRQQENGTQDDQEDVDTRETSVGGSPPEQAERHLNSAAGGVDNHNEGLLNTGQQAPGKSDNGVAQESSQIDHPDLSALNTLIEDMYERFDDAQVAEILRICHEVLSQPAASADDSTDLFLKQ